MAKRAMNRFGKSKEQALNLVINEEQLTIEESIANEVVISLVTPEQPNIKNYLLSDIQPLDYLGIAEVSVLEGYFSGLPDENSRIDNAKIIIEFFTKFPEKARLLSSSYYYLSLMPDSLVFHLIFVTSNYCLGRASWCVSAAKKLSEIWTIPLTAIIFARVLRECEGIDAERAVLEKAYLDSNDIVVFYNLISNLIDSDKVDEANAAIASIKTQVQLELADEISTVKENQIKLEHAIQNGLFAPEGDNDIYTDDMCRNNWISYYESFVTRREYVHGDRLILNHFLHWIDMMQSDLDVVLDFGALCAQPLYEAALQYSHIQFIGTDRQNFVADMNRTAYPLSNLKFDHGDIFDVMEKVGAIPGRKALVHIRTTCTLYPKFVEELYNAARKFGFTHIYMIENAGLVRTKLEFMNFQTMQEEALVTKHQLNIHNYRKQLEKAGFRVNTMERLSAPGLLRGEHPVNYLGSQYEIHAISD